MFESVVIPKRYRHSSFQPAGDEEWWDKTIKNGWGYFEYFIHIDSIGNVGSQHLWNNGFSVDESVMDDNKVSLGCINISKCKFALNNMYGDFTGIDFANKRIKVFVALHGKNYTVDDYGYSYFYDKFNEDYIEDFSNYRESFFMGEFIIKNIKRTDNIITIEAFNFFCLLDDYFNTSDFTNWNRNLAENILDRYNIPYYLYDIGRDENRLTANYLKKYTCRDVLKILGEYYGCGYRMKHSGENEYDMDEARSSVIENFFHDEVITYTFTDLNELDAINITDYGLYNKDIYSVSKSIKSLKLYVYYKDEDMYGDEPYEDIDQSTYETIYIYPTYRTLDPKNKMLSNNSDVREEILTNNKIHIFSLGSERANSYNNRTGIEIVIKDNPLSDSTWKWVWSEPYQAGRIRGIFENIRSVYFRKCSFSHTSDPAWMAPYRIKLNSNYYIITHSIFSSSGAQQSYGAGDDSEANVASQTESEQSVYTNDSTLSIRKNIETNSWNSIYTRISTIEVGKMSFLFLNGDASKTLTNNKISWNFECVCSRTSSNRFRFFGIVGGSSFCIVDLTNVTSSSKTVTTCKVATMTDL